MAKADKVSINALEKIAKEFENEVVVEWHDVNVIVRKTLTLPEMLKFVDSVTKSCFDQTTGAYLPELKDFAIRSNLMDTYANFSLPDNLTRQYDLLWHTDAVDMILQNIDADQFAEMISAIELKIANIASANTQAMYQQLQKAVSSINSMIEQVEGVFDGITGDDVSAMVGAIVDGGLDVDKFVDSVADRISGDK